MTAPVTTGALPGSTSVGPASQVWSGREWLWEATRWIDAALERRGIVRVPTTPRQPRVRPWSTQLVVDTDQGRVWFKAGVPETTCEVAVYGALTDVAPDLLPPVWAADAERCWMLVPDQGPIMRDVADSSTITDLMSAGFVGMPGCSDRRRQSPRRWQLLVCRNGIRDLS